MMIIHLLWCAPGESVRSRLEMLHVEVTRRKDRRVDVYHKFTITAVSCGINNDGHISYCITVLFTLLFVVQFS